MPSLSYQIVDAFTARAFGGNPAAVIVLDDAGKLDDATLQLIAREFQLSETAFLWPLDDSKGSYRLRWFTPTHEVKLCGHATLASARILFSRHADVQRLSFETVYSGTLSATKSESLIELNFPADSPYPLDGAAADKVISAHLAACPELKQAKVLGAFKSRAGNVLQVELASSQRLQQLKYDPSELTVLDGAQQSITCRAPPDDPRDIHSRNFAPNHGIAEDPVTGSMHTSLAPFWRERLTTDGTVATEARPLRAFQASARGGDLELVVTEDARVLIRGSSVVVAEGTLHF